MYRQCGLEKKNALQKDVLPLQKTTKGMAQHDNSENTALN